MRLTFDLETTIMPDSEWKEGDSLLKNGSPSPYLQGNKIVSCHYKSEYDSKPRTIFFDSIKDKQVFQEILNNTTLLVGFNIKFDLSWILECGFVYNKDIWDTQLVEYILSGGQLTTPSLNTVAERRGLPLKKDQVKEFWTKGINTDHVPRGIIAEYGEHDVWLTEQIYLKQIEEVGTNVVNENSAAN